MLALVSHTLYPSSQTVHLKMVQLLKFPKMSTSTPFPPTPLSPVPGTCELWWKRGRPGDMGNTHWVCSVILGKPSPTNWMNSQRFSERPLTHPPSFKKKYVANFSKNVCLWYKKSATIFVGSKINPRQKWCVRSYLVCCDNFNELQKTLVNFSIIGCQFLSISVTMSMSV